MFSKTAILSIITSLTLIGCLESSIPANPQTESAKSDFDFRQKTISGKNFLILSIDPTLFQMRLIENALPPDSKNIKKIHDENQSLLSFNGSFFDQNFKPLGLLVSEGKLFSPLKKSDLMNGIFTINQKAQPAMLDYEEFQNRQTEISSSLDFAIQSGPILITPKGEIAVNSNSTKKAGRTALGLNKNNNLTIIMLRQTLLDQENAISLYDFANLLANEPEFSSMGLHSVLNLDGGNSSGLAIGDQYFPELEKVQHIIITKNAPEHV